MTAADDVTSATVARCAHCEEPLPVRSTGRPAKFCSDSCRKTDHRLASAARQARASLPRLRTYLDEALDKAEAAMRRLHATGLSEDELLMRPEPLGDVNYAVGRALETLRYAARDHRDALATAERHPAGAATDEDDD
jgi:hypothetical protein